MKINPTKFNDNLKLLMPAVDSKGIVPILGYVCFGDSEDYGPYALCYNDFIGIVIFDEMFSDLDVAVPGEVLNKVLGTFSSEVLLESEEYLVKIKQGKTVMELPVLDAGSYLFAPPDTDGSEIYYSLEDAATTVITAYPEFIEALSLLIPFSGDDVMYDNQMGITVSVEEGDSISFYSTDNKTLTKIEIDYDGEGSAELNLPLSFCKQLITLFDEFQVESVELGVVDEEGSGYAFAQYQVGNEIKGVLFTKLSLAVDAGNFEDVIKKNVTKTTKYGQVPIGLEDCLMRTSIIASSATSDSRIKTTLSKGVLTFEASGDKGELVDEIPFDVKKGSAEFHISATAWKRGLGLNPTRMALLEHSVLMLHESGPIRTKHFIATTQG